MNPSRYMVVKDIHAKALVCYSSHRTAASAFAAMDKLRRRSCYTGLYVRDNRLGKRVKRPKLVR